MSKRVLLVEDSPVAREKITGILEELGCEVVSAGDGVEGLKVASQNAASLDLIVLDIQMPKADGITLLRYLRKVPDLEGTTVVMLTTQADKETVQTALQHGARDFLRKDATIAHITERLRFHLGIGGAAPAPTPPAGDPKTRVRELLMGGASANHIDGPCVLCHVPEKELDELAGAQGARQLQLYEAIAAGVAELNRRYPRLGACYLIEQVATEVSKHLKTHELIGWVLLLGRRQEGLSVAKMGGLAGLFEGRVVHMVCDPIASLPDRDRTSVERMGARLIEQKSFYEGGSLAMLEKNLLPPGKECGPDVIYRELARGIGGPPRRDYNVQLHYSAVGRQGPAQVDTFTDGAAVTIPYGSETLPADLWPVVGMLCPGGRALADRLHAAEGEAVYYELEVVEVTRL